MHLTTANEEFKPDQATIILAYIWNQTLKAEKRAKQYSDQPVKQILLIHLNLLNSYCMRDIIELYKRNGYHFISLPEALQQPAPIIDRVADSPALTMNRAIEGNHEWFLGQIQGRG